MQQPMMNEMTDEALVAPATSFGRDSFKATRVKPVGLGSAMFANVDRPLSREEKLALAGSPLADEGTWFKLAKEQDVDLQVAIARNPKATLNVLELLARTGHEEAQVAVAAHPQITASLLAT